MDDDMDAIEGGEWLDEVFRRGRRRDADFWEDLDGHWGEGMGRFDGGDAVGMV
jgi:hypothetical protein